MSLISDLFRTKEVACNESGTITLTYQCQFNRKSSQFSTLRSHSFCDKKGRNTIDMFWLTCSERMPFNDTEELMGT